jgi:hypothetical protein
MLEKPKSSMPNMTKRELEPVKSLRLNKNCLLAWLRTNHHYDSGALMTRLWAGLMVIERLQNFLSHLSSLRPSIHFTTETELENRIPFLNVLVVRKGRH